jgi:hypothetical protein
VAPCTRSVCRGASASRWLRYHVERHPVSLLGGSVAAVLDTAVGGTTASQDPACCGQQAHPTHTGPQRHLPDLPQTAPERRGLPMSDSRTRQALPRRTGGTGRQNGGTLARLHPPRLPTSTAVPATGATTVPSPSLRTSTDASAPSARTSAEPTPAPRRRARGRWPTTGPVL